MNTPTKTETKTTPETIAELRKLLAEARPLPWESHPMPGVKTVRNVCTMHFDSSLADLQLIVLGLNALPSLLSDLEAAQKALAEIRELAENSNKPTYLIEVIASTARHALAATEVK